MELLPDGLVGGVADEGLEAEVAVEVDGGKAGGGGGEDGALVAELVKAVEDGAEQRFG